MTRGKAAWYAEGLRFACSRCGHCCTGEGYVWVSEERIDLIARHLALEREACTRRYVRRVGGRLALMDKAGNTDCVFWEREVGCTIYEVRPTQCRTFPFWAEHLESEEAWREVAARCPGVGEGRRHSQREILVQLGRGR
jgi:Fe-S-cluster containining protein